MENNGIDEIDSVSPVSDEKKYNSGENTDLPNLVFPSVVISKLMKTLEDISKITKETYERSNNTGDAVSLGINVDSTEFTNTEDMLYTSLNADGVSNKPSYTGKDLGIRPLPVKSSGKPLNGDAAIARIASALGIGEVTQVPLWHSGFWVTLKPIKEIDLINLELELTNNQINLGRDTNSLVYSNYQVVLNRIIANFVLDNIENTTLDTQSLQGNLLDYIQVQDFNILVNGLLYSMYPNGYPLVRTCSNSIVMVDNKPKCNYVVSGNVDFKKMLYVNRPVLSKYHFIQMSKRNPNTVTLDDVIDYQKTLNAGLLGYKQSDDENIGDSEYGEYSVSYKIPNGTIFKFYLKTPSLLGYIDAGEQWISDIIKKSEEIFTDATTDAEKNRIINDTTATVIGGIYNSYISKIVINDVDVVEDIDSGLGMLTSDPELLEFLIDSVKDFINKTTVAAVGIPNYTCPKCKELQIENNENSFSDIIPINVTESFFALCVLKVQKVRSRNT